MLKARLAAKVEIDTATGCWNFKGCVAANGYGRVSGSGRADWAHRVYYRHLRGPIPDGMVIDHLCRNRRCVNPDHLEPVTDAENSARGIGPSLTRARHKAQTFCKRGHPLFGDNVRRDKRGSRICIACQSMHASVYRERHRKQNRVKKPVQTPDGRFASATEAASAYRISASAATWRARNEYGGWRFAAVLLELANS